MSNDLTHIAGIPIVNGDISWLSKDVLAFVERSAKLCTPDKIHICDGSEKENIQLLKIMEETGTLIRLPKYKNCWLARTNPLDVARVESRTFNCSEHREDSVPTPKKGVVGMLGNWISPADYEKAIQERFPGCMKGRTMYIIPFSMGPIGSPLAKVGIEITDSPYVVANMRIMTRMGDIAMKHIVEDKVDYVRCLHSVGTPKNGIVEKPSWPCDPERTIIMHKPDALEITSYGSGYGGNSLLGKKCFALRIGSSIAQKEGWLAEHMLILDIDCPTGEKKYIAAAFPSGCGKTNLAMMQSTMPGYQMECVGDDIAWMKFDKSGHFQAINAESGFFGIAPGTSMKTNSNAMKTITEDTIFANVATTSDGGVFWEGLEDTIEPGIEITDWLGKPWKLGESKTPAAHPNSRFCTSASHCPVIDSHWQDPEGVEIKAILFGGRRPNGVPLVYEAFTWPHGVFIGATLKSTATATAEHKVNTLMHDPFAMRPFFGYNFCHYMEHWLSMQDRAKEVKGRLPKVFFVNWFRKGKDGKFLWPGFGENSRIIDWILRRCEGEDNYEETPIGLIPKKGSVNLDGIKEEIKWDELFEIEKDFWTEEVKEIQKYFDDQVGDGLPKQIQAEIDALRERISKM